MEASPKIKLLLSPLDKALELAGKIFVLLLWGLAAYTFARLPTIIPIHFNASGEADNYGAKTMILLLPALASVIYFGLTQLNKYPHIFNYMTKITEENAQRQYSIATRMLRFLKLAILIIFILIILFTYLTTLDVVNGLGPWFLPFTFSILLIPVIVLIKQSFNKSDSKN